MCNWPSSEDIACTSINDLFMLWISAPCMNGARNRAQYMLQEGLRDKISTAHKTFLKR